MTSLGVLLDGGNARGSQTSAMFQGYVAGFRCGAIVFDIPAPYSISYRPLKLAPGVEWGGGRKIDIGISYLVPGNSYIVSGASVDARIAELFLG